MRGAMSHHSPRPRAAPRDAYSRTHRCSSTNRVPRHRSAKRGKPRGTAGRIAGIAQITAATGVHTACVYHTLRMFKAFPTDVIDKLARRGQRIPPMDDDTMRQLGPACRALNPKGKALSTTAEAASFVSREVATAHFDRARNTAPDGKRTMWMPKQAFKRERCRLYRALKLRELRRRARPRIPPAPPCAAARRRRAPRRRIGRWSPAGTVGSAARPAGPSRSPAR